jgi:hypothetical protein
VEPAGRDAVLDRSSTDASRVQLGALDHAVLPTRKRRDDLVDGKRDALTPYSVVKASRLAHAADLRATNATEHPPSMPT